MSDDVLRIRVAGPDEIRSWSSGEVTSVDLLNRRTRRPAYDGLFCEEIFGDVGDAHARRTRWGHLDLAGPVVHCWFSQGEPSVLGRLLGMAEKELRRVVAYEDFVVLDPGPTPLSRGQILNEAALHVARTAQGETFVADTGGPAIRRLLDGVTLPSGDPAGWLVLDCLPVLPPALRPLRLQRNGSVAAGDLNELYQRVLNRNNRLRMLLELNAPPVIVWNERRMLQQSVDALFDNGRLRQPVLGRRGRPLRSLADRVERRLTRDLVSKRADFSGRARVVPAPDVPPGTCGLPRSLARVLYGPFGGDLDAAMHYRPVLLDLRAFDAMPTDGEVIRLNPLDLTRPGVACGDVVSVHLPLSNQARAEASLLLRPADAGPVLALRREAVLGLYHLTADPAEGAADRVVATPAEVVAAHEHGRLAVRDPVAVWFPPGTTIRTGAGDERLAWPVPPVRTTAGRVLFHQLLTAGTPFHNLPMTARRLAQLDDDAPLLERLQRAGFAAATRAGLSVGLGDLLTASNATRAVAEAVRDEEKLDRQYHRGDLTAAERVSRRHEAWSGAVEAIAGRLFDELSRAPDNALHAMARSGAAGGQRELRRLLVAGPAPTDRAGDLVGLPPTPALKAGLGPWGYFFAAGQDRRDRRRADRHRRRAHALTCWLAHRMVTPGGIRAALAVGAACGRLSDYTVRFVPWVPRATGTVVAAPVPLALSRAIALFTGRGGVPREDLVAELVRLFAADGVALAEADLDRVVGELGRRGGLLARAAAGDFRRVLSRAAVANQAEPVDGLMETAVLGRLVEG